MLEHRVADLVARIAAMDEVVLLDYTTNGDVADLSRPLSHAALVRAACDAEQRALVFGDDGLGAEAVGG
ncbi:DUF6939 family protein [Spirillospora sp. CA-253888]